MVAGTSAVITLVLMKTALVKTLLLLFTLNADFRPELFPVIVVSQGDTIKAVVLNRVTIISEYDSYIHSPSMSMRLPMYCSGLCWAKPEPCLYTL